MSSAAAPPRLRHGHLGNHSCAPAETALRTWAVSLHVVAQRSKLPSNVVSRHPRFDIEEEGGNASLDVMRPRETFSRNTMPPACIKANHVKRVCPYLFRGWSLRERRTNEAWRAFFILASPHVL